jgi:hypothetical protein
MQPDDPASVVILSLADHLGVPPVSVALYLPFLILVANRIARLIPDDAEGPLKWLRVGLSVIGVKVEDRKVSKIKESVEDLQARVAPTPTFEPFTDLPEEEAPQGALALDEPVQIPHMFVSGSARMQSTQKED